MRLLRRLLARLGFRREPDPWGELDDEDRAYLRWWTRH